MLELYIKTKGSLATSIGPKKKKKKEMLAMYIKLKVRLATFNAQFFIT